MSGKAKEPYVCHLCLHPSGRHYDHRRHLTTHGIDKEGQALSAKEQARFKSYNSHKSKANLKVKRTYKSVEFLDTALDTDESDTTPVNSPAKQSKVDSPKSSPIKPPSPPKFTSHVNDDLMLSESSSSDGEVFSMPEPTMAEVPKTLQLRS